MSLGMIPQGTPAVGLGLCYESGPDGIEIDIGQAVNQGIAVIHDHALESLGPEKAFSVVKTVEV